MKFMKVLKKNIKNFIKGEKIHEEFTFYEGPEGEFEKPYLKVQLITHDTFQIYVSLNKNEDNSVDIFINLYDYRKEKSRSFGLEFKNDGTSEIFGDEGLSMKGEKIGDMFFPEYNYNSYGEGWKNLRYTYDKWIYLM